MFRAVILVSLLSLAVVPSRTFAAAVAPEPATPAGVAPVAVAPATAGQPGPELGLGALQVVAGYGAEIGGLVGLAAIGIYPKQLGWRSDYANLGFVAALAPALAGGAVCGTGHLSRSYRGRCATTLLGAYVGAALGTLLGMAMAPSPGPDDTAAFERGIAAMAGVILLTPIGATIGYHAGKRELPSGGA